MATFHASGDTTIGEPSRKMVLTMSSKIANPLQIVESEIRHDPTVDEEIGSRCKDPYKELELYLAKVNVSITIHSINLAMIPCKTTFLVKLTKHIYPHVKEHYVIDTTRIDISDYIWGFH